MLVTAIGSVERLEVLLLTHRERAKSFTARGVSGALGISPTRAENHLALLCGRGFLAVTLGSDVVYAFRPALPDLARQVDAIADAWRSRREEIAALLEGRSPDDPARAFAEAFRIRRRRS